MAYVWCAGLILCFATYFFGGVTAPQWNYCLLAVCLLSLAVWLPLRGRDPGRSDLRFTAILMLLAAYVAFQLLPLPLKWMEVLSPARAELARATSRVGIAVNSVPLSASPTLTVTHLLRLLCFICFFFLVRELTRRLDRWPWTLTAPPIVIAVGEATLGVAQNLSGAIRAHGTYVNADHFSCFLQMCLSFPLVLVAIAIRRRRRRRDGSTQPTPLAERILSASILIACAAIIFLGALDSMSRMGVVAIALSLMMLTALIPVATQTSSRKGAWKAWALVALAGVGLAFFVLVSTPGALIERMGDPAGSPLTADARLQNWRETVHLAAAYPIFGSGLGTYASVFQKYRASAPTFLVDYAHNDYLQLLSELGIIGFAIAAFAALTIVVRIFRAVSRGPSTAHRLIAAAAIAALIALMLDSLVDFDFYIPANAMLGAWVAGMGSGIGLVPVVRQDIRPPTPRRRSRRR